MTPSSICVPYDVGVGVPQTSNRADLLLGTCCLLVSFQRLCVDWQSVGGPVRPNFITLVVVVTTNTCSAGPAGYHALAISHWSVGLLTQAPISPHSATKMHTLK